MKKLLALLLALCLALSLAACGGSDTPAETKAPETKAAEPAETTGATEAPATEAPETEPQKTEAPAIDLGEILVVDNESAVIKITGMEIDEFWGPTLKVSMENKTDKAMSFSLRDASVNGVNYFAYFGTDVAAGKKANDNVSFANDVLNAKLGDFTDIELRFQVREADNWDADYVVDETVRVYPYGQEKAANFVYETDEDDVVIADNDSFRIILTGREEDDYYAYATGMLVENKTDRTLGFRCEDVSVNGYMCDPYWGETVRPHTVNFGQMSWSEEDFKNNSIDKVEELEMKVVGYDDENWLDGNLYEANALIKLENDVPAEVNVVENKKPGDSGEEPAAPAVDVPTDTDITPVVGYWKYDLNVAKAMELSGETELEEMGEDIMAAFEDVSLEMILDLREDGTFTMGYEEDAAKNAAQAMLEGLTKVLPKVLAEMYGITEEELADMMEQQGTSLEDLISEMDLDEEEMAEQLAEATTTGTFQYEDGKLYLVTDDNRVDVMDVELEGDELHVTGMSQGNFNEMDLGALLPLVFTK